VAELTAMLVGDGAASDAPSSQAFVERIAALGGELAVTVGVTRVSFALTADARYGAEAVALFGTMLARRELAARHFAATRAGAVNEALARARDDDDAAAAEVLVRALLGGGEVGSHRGHAGSYSELSRVRLDHCTQLLQRRYVGARMVLRMAGGTDPESLRAQAARALARLPRGTPRTEPGPSPVLAAGRPLRLYLVDRPGRDRATIVAAAWLRTTGAGKLGVLALRDAQLRAAVGAAVAPLAAEVRATRLVPLADAVGWTVVVRSDPAEAARALGAVCATLAGVGAPDPEQIDRDRRVLLGRLGQQLDTPTGTLALLRDGAMIGPDSSAAAQYASELRAITAAEIAALGPSPVGAAVVLGDAEQLGPTLATLAEVQVLDPTHGFAPQRSFGRQPPGDG
jgi:predicted Zn-dependent peptidase